MPNDHDNETPAQKAQILSLVAEMTRAQEKGKTSFDKDDTLDKIRPFMVELNELCGRQVLDHGLDATTTLKTLLSHVAVCIANRYEDYPLVIQLGMSAEYAGFLADQTGAAIALHQRDKERK